MWLADIIVEHPFQALQQRFTYECDATLKRGCIVSISFATRLVVGVVEKVYEVSDETNFDFELKQIEQVISEEPYYNEELFALAQYMSKHYVCSEISCLKCMMPSKLKPTSKKRTIKTTTWLKALSYHDKLSPKQQIAYDALLAKDYPKKEFVEKYKTMANKLLQLGAIEAYEKEVSAIYEDIKLEPLLILTPLQQKVYEQLLNTKKMVSLLHGVTGSGKSEIFMHLAYQYLQNKKQVLILVPEISLTPMMVTRVKKHFGKEVAIYHSGLNDQEKYEQYQAVKHNEVKVVVGTRSAIFLPFTNLGLIVMDEEHESSYKQDCTPRYHARDIVLKRGAYHQAKVVLASATPSLESYARAYKGVYELVSLNNRINNQPPKITFVNMKDEMRNYGDYMLSKALKQAIALRLANHEQVILLLNRRGYQPLMKCVDCGWISMCPHCDLTMTYHKDTHNLKCHCCDTSMKVPKVCPSCNSTHFRMSGMGTQRLEEYVKQLFPQARTLRYDYDTTTHKNAHEKLIKSFADYEADILIGTQMIAKGLDFPNVTLVGVVNADSALQRGDYRSSEACFDLLLQASGRSGRNQKPGEVYLQVYDDKHYVMQAIAHQNYPYFFQEEMKYRHLANYPPYSYLVAIVFKSTSEELVLKAINNMQKLNFPKEIRIIGPAQLLKRRDEYRYRYILKGKNEEKLVEFAQNVYDNHYATKQKAKIEIDINPLYLE